MTPKDHKLAAVVFTDIVGFSRMMETDENGTFTFLEFHHDLITTLASDHRGGVIKTVGDAFLLDFPTALNAVTCSVAIQEGIGRYNKSNGKAVALRIGVHLGDIYFYDNDALGEGINIASRLQTLSQPGTITISREVYNQVNGKIPLRIESLGQVPLKNISREVLAYRILSEPLPTLASTRESPQLSSVISAERPSPKPSSDWFTRYKTKTLDKIKQKAQGWWRHLFTFLGVNALLHIINLYTTEFPWATLTALSWGIGLLGHLAYLMAGRGTKKMLQAAGNLGEAEGKELKRVIECQQGLFTSLAYALTTGGLLIFIQVVTSGPGGFPWGWMAAGFVLLGSLGRLGTWLGLSRQRREWKERLMSVQHVAPQRSPEDGVLAKARELEASIRRSLEGLKSKSLPLVKDMGPMLDQYMVQIGKLAHAKRDVSRVLDDLALDYLGGQEEKIQSRLNQAKSESLRREYTRALDQLRKQKISQGELEEHQELINVKIDGALQTLKLIQLDLTRIRSHGGIDGTESLRILQKRSDELSNDLLDYTSSWQEVETWS